MYDSEVEEYVMFERELLKEALESNIVEVTFNKVDGTERVMNCTLMEDVIPSKIPTKETKEPRAVNANVLNVWDIDKRDWRSFRVANVTGYEFVK
jgi:hypothetical protein